MPSARAAVSITSRDARSDASCSSLRAHLEELEDADAALVARLAAARAAALLVEERRLRASSRPLVDVEGEQLVPRRLVRLGAVRAELAREPLREHGRDRPRR